MVDGLRERERVRDLFGRHVGREVAAAAEKQRPQLGGEERHVAVVFVDIIGSTQLVTSQPPAEVVRLLNRFFAVIVDEVDRHHGLVNKFEGDASLAIFGAPNRLEQSRERGAGRRAGDGRTVGRRNAGVSGRHRRGRGSGRRRQRRRHQERFEYTVIGEPVNEAARLCELAKTRRRKLLASSDPDGASESEREHWSFGRHVKLRGHDQRTQLASPVEPAKPRK